jgi:hypothetical protein
MHKTETTSVISDADVPARSAAGGLSADEVGSGGVHRADTRRTGRGNRRGARAQQGGDRVSSPRPAPPADVTSLADRRPTVGVRCDAGPATGVGHLVRCVALAEELVSRGLGVVFLGDLGGLPFAQRQLADRGLPLLPAPVAPEDLADLAVSMGLAAVVLDGYHLDPGCGTALTARGLPVLALSDGGFGADQRATIHLDQNLGAGDDGAEDFERQKRYAAFTAVFNVTGQPAVSVPLHWTDDDLPVGTMLVGRPADEATLLALAAQLEQARPWAHRHPPAWDQDASPGGLVG